jgi:hypothetical protein
MTCDTARLEAAVMTLAEQGRFPKPIADELGLPLETVKRVMGYMRETGAERCANAAARHATEALGRALAACPPPPEPTPRQRPRTFEEQLAAVRAGAHLVEVRPLRRPDPDMTLGGVPSGLLG